MKEIRATPGSSIPIGRCGENLARTVLFDIAAWVGMYGSGTAQLIHQRPGEEAPYPCNVGADRASETKVWKVQLFTIWSPTMYCSSALPSPGMAVSVDRTGHRISLPSSPTLQG